MFLMEKEFEEAKVALDNVEKLERSVAIVRRKLEIIDRNRVPLSVAKMRLDAVFNNCSTKAIC